MSLSDSDNDQFLPLTLSSLETLDGERSNKTKESDPDFNRFKLLFEKPTFEKEEAYEFKAIYDAKKEQEEIVFRPLIERKESSLDTAALNRQKKDSEQDLPSDTKEPEEPEETPEEKGYREGFEKGLEQGMLQGQQQGHEEGFKKGEAKGFETGEQKGLETGELQGFEKGIAAGEEKGTQQTREEGVEILNSLEKSLKTADQTLELLVEKYEERIISLIQQIAKKAVMAQIEINDEIVKHLILDAFKTLVKPEEVVLSISLEDYEYIEMIKDEFFEQIDSLSSVSVRSDASIKRGGCKITTNTASISSDPESRLEAIFQAIKAAGVA
ncbi:MAG: flagellar biosynthesis/type III secretory pathway protein [Proteobacteria bacterium]|nr:flagellar biosynthesis/type III secretory pathway protein [Pseudomonadota bacterium]MBU1584668.1 flagellar biosynthesis/type III secretory pathway protein [Pseudomonadota bacterium]MBU2631536.1 flagellar biosynthesis/type III secretory pathway protein [Pseudomonadota bacterium]